MKYKAFSIFLNMDCTWDQVLLFYCSQPWSTHTAMIQPQALSFDFLFSCQKEPTRSATSAILSAAEMEVSLEARLLQRIREGSHLCLYRWD